MESDDLFGAYLAPVFEDRSCAACGAAVHGPQGVICPACADADRRERFATFAAFELTAARESIPAAYRMCVFGGIELERRLRNTGMSVGYANAPIGTVLLRGPSAAGKTSFAAAIFHNHLARASRMTEPRTDASWAADDSRVRRVATSRFARAFAIGAEQPWSDQVAEWRRADVLVIDDLGAEPDGYRANLVDMISARIDNLQPCIVTSWLDDRALELRYGEGVLRRLLTARPSITCLPAGAR